MSTLRLAVLCLLALPWFSLRAQPPQPPPAATAAPAYLSNPRYVAAIDEAMRLKRARQYLFELDALKKANKIAEGKSLTCLDSMFELQMSLNDTKGALATATQYQTAAVAPRDKSIAERNIAAAILMQAGDKPKPAQLEAAHTALQAAIADYPGNNSARWSDACVLARMGKTADARVAFNACAEAASAKDPMRNRAKHFAEDPSLSLHKLAPAFEVTTLDGTSFNLDNMTGRVVLVDFWATWCGPCKEELPNIQKIAKEFANEPLTIISISWDADEGQWKDFVSKHEMTWLQYRDANHQLSDRFGINAIPHYFTIDSDGVLTAEMLGSGHDVEGKLKKLLKRARESRPVATSVAEIKGTS